MRSETSDETEASSKRHSNDIDPVKAVERQFLAMVSHEIRTPLNGILGMASLLAETPLNDSQSQYVDAIRLSGTRLLDLLNNVLDFTRMESGILELEKVCFSPIALAQSVVELLSPRAHNMGLDIGVMSSASLTDLVEGDEARIRQILFNLVGNAIKFTEQGGVIIDIQSFKTDDSKGICFTVRDSGRGISLDAQARLFDAFVQVHNDDAQKDSGVGLGLAIVKRLVDSMSGKIEVVSRPGYGTSFSVYLPLPVKDTTAHIKVKNTTQPVMIALWALSPVVALVVQTAFQHSPHKIWICQNMDEIDKADIALIDARTSAEDIRKITTRTPGLVLLRTEDRGLIEQFRDLGCAGYLIKPLRPKSLRERIELAQSDDSFEIDERAVESGISGRILIADDNPVNAMITSRALGKAGYQTDIASTGVEAIQALEHVQYDLILMDLRMPIMDGFEATCRIRTMESAKAHTPIIAISAEITPDIEKRARKVGVNAVATKPIDAQGLRAIARKWCCESV